MKLGLRSALASLYGSVAGGSPKEGHQRPLLDLFQHKASTELTFKPEKESMAVLQSLENANFDSVMLYGGALRDDYLRNVQNMDVPTNDYDVQGFFDSELLESLLKEESQAEQATRIFAAHLSEKLPNAQIEKVAVNFHQGEPQAGATIIYDDGRKIDMMIDVPSSPPLSLEERLLKRNFGGAPINSIAMDSSGTVMHDSRFEDHAKRRVFQPAKAIEEGWLPYDPTVKKFQKKGLTYVPPALEDEGHRPEILSHISSESSQTAPKSPNSEARPSHTGL